MNHPKLHTALSQLLEESGVRSECPEVVFFPAYIPGEPDVVGSGIGQLVQFRLLHPETPVLFFSFLHKEQLISKDEFGVLQLTGTEFIQLPCSKETIVKAATKHSVKPTTVNDVAWKTFSESACKSLLKQKITIINHKQELAFINKVGLGLRLAIDNVINYPEQRSDTMINFNKKYAALLAYVKNPQIVDIINLSRSIHQTNDTFLNSVSNFTRELDFISNPDNRNRFSDLKEAIIRIQDTITELEKNN